jgi:hypothetical protein
MLCLHPEGPVATGPSQGRIGPPAAGAVSGGNRASESVPNASAGRVEWDSSVSAGAAPVRESASRCAEAMPEMPTRDVRQAAFHTRAALSRVWVLERDGPTTSPTSDARAAESPASVPRDRLASRRSTRFPSARCGSGCAPPVIVHTADTRALRKWPSRKRPSRKGPPQDGEPDLVRAPAGPRQLDVRQEDTWAARIGWLIHDAAEPAP